MKLFVNKTTLEVERKLTAVDDIRAEALSKNCVIVNLSLEKNLSMDITDPAIDTGDHFNIGVSLEDSKEPVFYKYSGSERNHSYHLHWWKPH